ncbi:MAG: DUF2878 domain-containing protein [Gammaproteobacteria bacterium]|mgnify:CR=1 FL=1|nr:DUF2878 domain-containing protein [Gammaproteobacteria bacterium]
MSAQLINVALFQAGWFLCVLYPSALSAAFGLALVGVHSALQRPHWAPELRIIGLLSLPGLLLDSLLLGTGVLAVVGSDSSIIPLWLVAIWLLFSATLTHSLRWMIQRPYLPWIAGPIGGPLAYMAAERLGAITINETPFGLIALALGWGLVFPLQAWMARRYLQTGQGASNEDRQTVATP